MYLLECLQKTPPPVLIFCESKTDVDDIHEYLMLKGVEAVRLSCAVSRGGREVGTPHSGKDQEAYPYPHPYPTPTPGQVGIHAGKDQEEREYAIRMFKEQRADRTLPLPLPLTS